MTWKSYAAVSGATVLAGWLAASPPANAPGTTPAPVAPGAAPVGTSGPSEIELEAARLQARVRQEIEYQRPERNPFRFGGGTARSRTPEPVAPSIPDPAVVPTPVAPPLSLSGFAEDQVGDQTDRTAILSSPGGVLLVREGDPVMGQYRVGRMDSSSVEIVSLTDGTVFRLTLRR